MTPTAGLQPWFVLLLLLLLLLPALMHH